MNLLIRGVRVIDPARAVDAVAHDVRLQDGVITAIGRGLDDLGLPVMDMTPADGRNWRVLAPGFVDLHAHLREPGGEEAETVASGARAAAAGGFTHVLAMANTQPPIDSPERVEAALDRSRHADVGILTTAAVSQGLEGRAIVDMAACARSGAVAFSDDGRNAATKEVLVAALREAAQVMRPVLVHPEDESSLAPGATPSAVVRTVERPAHVEAAAVRTALRALRDAGTGHLHLQHLSTAESVAQLRTAREQGLHVTAEVTPHHLAMWFPLAEQPRTDPLLKVNPPLRTREDRDAVLDALREGVIDAVATDHAPHPARDKARSYADAAPGMIGLETALAACVTLGDMGGDWLPTLIERLTVGPQDVIGPSGLPAQPSLRVGEPASCVLFDAEEEWIVGEQALRSQSRNTPLMGSRLRARVLLTVYRGRAVYHDSRLPLEMLVPARV